MTKKELTHTMDDFKFPEDGTVQVQLEFCGVNKLVGKILTIIDASYQNKKQCEAVKSLVKQEIWSWAHKFQTAATMDQIEEMFLEENSELCDDTTAEEQMEHYVYPDDFLDQDMTTSDTRENYKDNENEQFTGTKV